MNGTERFLASMIVLGLTALAPACRSKGAMRSEAPQPVIATRPVEGDPALPDRISVVDARFADEAGGKVAYFSLALAEGETLDVLFHVAWSDAAQRPIAELPQAWHAATLTRDRPVLVRAPAPDPRAQSFHLLFQRPGAVQ
jgi:hypothetical protein